jgi:hypothetical protein
MSDEIILKKRNGSGGGTLTILRSPAIRGGFVSMFSIDGKEYWRSYDNTNEALTKCRNYIRNGYEWVNRRRPDTAAKANGVGCSV